MSAPKWLDAFLVLVIAALAFLLASFPARNADVWMHLVGGRDVIHGVPSSDAAALSRTWLYDVLCYGVFTMLGPAGLVMCKALAATALALIVLRMSRGQNGLWIAAACTVLAVLVMSTRVLLQPATASYLLLGLAVWWAWGARDAAPERQGAALLPALLPPWPLLVVFVLWANIDGRFVLGLAVVGLIWIGQALDAARAGRAAAGPALACVLARLAMVAAACLLNPHHLTAFDWPEELGWFVPTVRPPVSPLDSAYLAGVGRTPAGLAYYPLLILGLLSFLLNGRGWQWQRFLPWLAAAAVSVTNARAIPVFAIVGGPVLAWNLQDFFARSSTEAMDRRLAPRALLGMRLLTFALGLTFVVAAWPGWLHAPPFEPRRWEIDTPPALEQGALTLRHWHDQGKLRPLGRSLHVNPDSLHAFAWFFPEDRGVLASTLFGSTESAAEQVQRMRDAGVDRLVVYDADRDRLLAILDQALADPGQWPLLAIEGDVMIFGWRDPTGRAGETFAGRELDLDRLAFHPASADRAPRAVDEDAESPRLWWHAFTTPAPPRPLDRDEATLHLTHAEARRRVAPYRHFAAWQGANSAALFGAGAVGPPLDAQLRLMFLDPRFPESGLSIDSLPRPDRFAHQAAQQFALHRDDAPPALVYLAVRAARRALAKNPRDAQAQVVLGESYLRLLRGTRERVWGKRFPEFLEMRRAQISTALNRALALAPDHAQAHLSLFGLYAEMGYRDLARDHLRRHVQLMRAAIGRQGDDGAEAQLAALEEQLRRIDDDVAGRTKTYEADAAGVRVLDRANLALQQGLAGKARDMLLESDVAAFGSEGLGIELDLLLKTGRARAVRDWTDPGHKDALGGSAYHWARARAYAALGDYERAQAELQQLGAIGRDPNAPVQRLLAALVAKQAASEQPVGAQLPHLFLRGLREAELRSQIGELLRQVRQEADVNVLRGLLFLEQGDPDEADVRFRLALTVWGGEAAAAAGAGLDFGGRVVAESCLPWLE